MLCLNCLSMADGLDVSICVTLVMISMCFGHDSVGLFYRVRLSQEALLDASPISSKLVVNFIKDFARQLEK